MNTLRKKIFIMAITLFLIFTNRANALNFELSTTISDYAGDESNGFEIDVIAGDSLIWGATLEYDTVYLSSLQQEVWNSYYIGKFGFFYRQKKNDFLQVFLEIGTNRYFGKFLREKRKIGLYGGAGLIASLHPNVFLKWEMGSIGKGIILEHLNTTVQTGHGFYNEIGLIYKI